MDIQLYFLNFLSHIKNFHINHYLYLLLYFLNNLYHIVNFLQYNYFLLIIEENLFLLLYYHFLYKTSINLSMLSQFNIKSIIKAILSITLLFLREFGPSSSNSKSSFISSLATKLIWSL